MAEQVIWSLRAHKDKKEILDYWKQHNKSSGISEVGLITLMITHHLPTHTYFLHRHISMYNVE
jgi:hypothetical protein